MGPGPRECVLSVLNMFRFENMVERVDRGHCLLDWSKFDNIVRIPQVTAEARTGGNDADSNSGARAGANGQDTEATNIGGNNSRLVGATPQSEPEIIATTL